MAFADAALRALDLRAGQRLIDVGCGSGGASLLVASRGVSVVAVGAASHMVARTHERAAQAGVEVDARVMDGTALDVADAAFDVALSVFGVVLFPDAIAGMTELRRVVRPGGRVAVVTWTGPQHDELATMLRQAVQSVWPEQPAAPLPAQLRYREEADFRALFAAAGLAEVDIVSGASPSRRGWRPSSAVWASAATRS